MKNKLNALEIEKAVGESLISHGFKVQKIQETTESKTPDFELEDSNGVKYLIEVKAKDDDPYIESARMELLRTGAIFQELAPVTFRNRMDGIVRSAANQLRCELPAESDVIRILWVVAAGRNPSAQIDQFRATLYGSTRVWSLDSREGHRECFYFRNSSFFTYSDALDAAIVGSLQSSQLFINSLSPRYQKLKTTALATLFDSAIVDPIEQEILDFAYIVDGKVDRGNPTAVLQFLENKYKVKKLQYIDLSHISGTVLFG